MFSCRCDEGTTEESFSGCEAFCFYAPDQPGTFLYGMHGPDSERVFASRDQVEKGDLGEP